MRMGTYVINLDTSGDRWNSVISQSCALGFEINRVAAIDGRAIAPTDYVDVDWHSFRRHAGREMLPGEYGCYRSHLKCLAALAESSFDAAVIMEDDVSIGPDILDRAAAALECSPKADIVRLFNHRTRGFIRTSVTSFGDEIGRCLHGPQGSAACYAVRRDAAAELLPSLQWMSFPFDVALERGWHHGCGIYTTRQNVVVLAEDIGDSLIGRRRDYRRIKYAGLRRLPTHAARVLEYCSRVHYVLTG